MKRSDVKPILCCIQDPLGEEPTSCVCVERDEFEDWLPAVVQAWSSLQRASCLETQGREAFEEEEGKCKALIIDSNMRVAIISVPCLA